MNFFENQDRARRNTRWSLVLFLITVVLIIGITTLFVSICYWLIEGHIQGDHSLTLTTASVGTSFFHYYNWQTFGKIALFIGGTIFCVTLFKWFRLRRGGKAVAEWMAAIQIYNNTENKNEKLLLNVVEEMALASNMPVPPVYLLKSEKGINAFAAGHSPSDAIIAVTQGALDQFNREQLQGVIAHEFSHILNGDMRLNLRLVSMLGGILFIVEIGRFLIEGGHRPTRQKRDGRIFLLGIGLIVIGWTGHFFASIIKSVVSRQREFLADASAVQFTRNPQGIADALKIIGGYTIGSRMFGTAISEINHMFIGNAQKHSFGLPTHPPLADRIKKIQPRWNGKFIHRKVKILKHNEANKTATYNKNIDKKKKIAAALSVSLTAAEEGNANTLEALKHRCSDSFGASALVYSLLLVKDDEKVKEKQLNAIQLTGIAGMANQTIQIHKQICKLSAHYRLSMIEMAMPALKTLSSKQYHTFKHTLLLLIGADNHYELFEWCIYQLVRHYLAADFEKRKADHPLYKQAAEVADDYALVLSLLAYRGHKDQKKVKLSFGRASNRVGLYAIKLLPQEQCRLDSFIKAVNRLARCYPMLKLWLLNGLVDCARHDGHINIEEKEIITTIAATMDCPCPNLLELEKV